MDTMHTRRVVVTDAANEVIKTLKAEHGPLMFHQSGGCCDGSSPMCYPLGEFRVGASDVLLGRIHGCPFYMARDQFELWQNTHLRLQQVKKIVPEPPLPTSTDSSP